MIDNIKPNNIIFTENIPNCKFYIGHYSSLLKTLSNLDSKILIWDLDNHKTPEDYYKYSDYNTNDWDELIKQIDMKSNLKKFIIGNEYNFKNNNPIKNMAYQIVKASNEIYFNRWFWIYRSIFHRKILNLDINEGVAIAIIIIVIY